METVLVFSLGLVVGWNFLPQPAFVKSKVDQVVAWVKAKVTSTPTV